VTPEFPIPIISVLIGTLILLFGRRLFWLCVAAVGFAAGIEITPFIMHEPSPLLALAIALILGLLGALFALFLQKIAILVAGFLAGGRLAVAIAASLFFQQAHYSGIIFLIGGVIGALLLLAVFDWALIILSSVVGAHLIQSAITLPASGATILFVVLTILGILVQGSLLRRSRAVG